MRNFQIILLFVFGAIAVLAVLIFSGVFSSNKPANNGSQGHVVMWGPFPENDMRGVLDSFEQKEQNYSINYVQKDLSTLQRDLTQALSRGNGPDIVLIPEYMLAANEDILQPLETQTFTDRQFFDYFTQGSRVFLSSGHIFAFPFVVDPVVLYWNRSLFQQAALPAVPTTWSQVLTLPSQLTQKSLDGTIAQSAIALGGVENIAHLKEIISTFILQTGDSIVGASDTGKPLVSLGDTEGPASIFDFYNNFSNPHLSTYSWNSSLPLSSTAFTGGVTAMYLGTASDYSVIPNENPHLDFDVAVVPQITSGGVRTTFAHIFGFALLKASPNALAAYAVVQKLAFGDTPSFVEANLKLPPVRNDLLAKPSADPVMAVFEKSAVLARSWLDPNYAATTKIFSDALRSSMAGALDSGSAVSQIAGLIKEEFTKLNFQ